MQADSPSRFRHRHRVAVITGAGSGIGAATALALAGGGWRVVLAGRRESALRRGRGPGAGLPGGLLPVPTDVTEEVVGGRPVRPGGRPASAGSICCSTTPGCSRRPGAGRDHPAEWNAIVAVNLTGAFLCTREAFRVMRSQEPQGGRIINNGSISAHAPRPRSIGYTVTKHAITGLTKSHSLDGRPYDIACGQIDIGNAATGLRAVRRRHAAAGRQRPAGADDGRRGRRPRGGVHGRTAADAPTCRP